jgi:hypothetical protein
VAEAAERLHAAARAEPARSAAKRAGDERTEAVGAAWRAAREAEARAAAAERRSRELATLVCGEPRRLTAAELAELRAGGPSGPAVLAVALRSLHRSRASGDRTALGAALAAVASAAVRWRDRL